MAGVIIENKETAYKFNQLAREQMKTKLLQDIVFDLQVCKLERLEL